jgi:hypothetical protein
MMRAALIFLALTLPAGAQTLRWPAEQKPTWDPLLRLCIFCTIPVGRAPLPDMPRESSDIFYRHQVLYGTHLLRLSTTDLIIDSGEWREKRLFAFATRFADQECSGRFRMIKAVRQTTTAAQFSFRCK